MVTATPDTVGQVLEQVVRSAADAAAGAPQGLEDVFAQAGRTLGDTVEEAQRLPADALHSLQQLVDPPDWASLIVFVLLRIQALDPDHLSVGAMQPAGWSRTLTLTYTLEAGTSVTIGFAMTDPGLTHGIVLQASDGLALPATAVGPLTLAVTSAGDASWRLAFGSGLQAPAQQASVDATLTWDPGIHVGDDVAGLDLGALRLGAVLSTRPGEPLYALTLGLGDPAGAPGAKARVDLSELLGALGAVVHVAAVDQSYSPRVVLTQGSGPQFTLGETSSA